MQETEREFAARRAVVLQSQCRVPPGFTLFCATCGKPMTRCGCQPRVTLPTAPKAETKPAEETQQATGPGGLEWCDVCNFAKIYCKGH